MITPVSGKKEAFGVPVPKPIDPVKTVNNVVTPKVVVSIEEKGKDVPQDQVGQCDNLTASYWG